MTARQVRIAAVAVGAASLYAVSHSGHAIAAVAPVKCAAIGPAINNFFKSFHLGPTCVAVDAGACLLRPVLGSNFNKIGFMLYFSMNLGVFFNSIFSATSAMQSTGLT